MNKEDLYGLLEDYLDGNLSTAERTNLEARLAADPALASELALLRELRQRTADLTATQEFERRLAEKLRQAGAAHFEKKPAAATVHLLARSRFRLAIAASIILLACLAGWLFFAHRPLSNEQLFARFFEPPASLGASRSGSSQAPVNDPVDWKSQVEYYYRQGNYALALGLMQEMETSFGQFPSSDYFYQRGILYLVAGFPKEALEDFTQVRTGHENERIWYSAWAFLKMEKRQEAIGLFEKIARSESPWRERAAAVLKEME